ncbi:ATP-dependent nuclease [Jeotgalibacillus proteolyticus]|uniref:ATP-dependent endonuclease n=1 Tax=Jeotgalibacillus proteolyticus TaxID=2082395 RepID=A0A2S5G651_9BACL|nr:AAA family ATPase [Jeotgalibacillus proteolyticus]PPA68431.1 ATP-dependent endonuclease [Jeotgalibacillus proteolyticus]
MKLTKMILKNYRSFGPESSTINITDLTAFIGHNSAGKTAILSALQKMFGDSKINKADFHIPFDKSSEEIEKNSLSIEVHFEFFKQNENADSYAIPIYFENFIVNEEGANPYIAMRLEASLERGNDPEGIIDYKFYYVVQDEGDESNNLKQLSIHDKSKIKVIYIPAVRNPSEQLKNATGTILWRILKQINWKEIDKSLVNKKIEELDSQVSNQEGISMIQRIISSQWKNYHNDARYKEANINFGSNDLDTILKKLDVEFTPSHTEKAFKVNDLGDGLKSLFYLTLIDSLLELENTAIEEIKRNIVKEKRILNVDPPALTLVLVEEPENHVSPHLLGKVIKNLKSIQSHNNAQILITSHNPTIIKRIEPTEIRHLRIDKKTSTTVVKEIMLPNKQDMAYKYVKEAVRAYPELYFSSLVILGEGDSEEILLQKFLHLHTDDLDSVGISIVPLGGRHVNHFWKLLNQLGIPFITLLDLDRERDGGGWGRIKYALNQLIENGVKKEVILKLKNENILSDSALENMHTRNLKTEKDIKILKAWVTRLENYNIYFSYPLDIDFIMIEHYLDSYLMTLSDGEGPLIKIDENEKQKRIHNLNDEEKKKAVYVKRIEDSVKKTLKENGGNGETYSDIQKELMIWYNYFFLTRGKPVTHLQALNYIEDAKLIEHMPEVFRRLSEKARTIIKVEE